MPDFFSVVICPGTQNGLSVTGTLDNQYKLIQQYTGCEIVMGNLEIIMMEHTRDFSFLRVSFSTALQLMRTNITCSGISRDKKRHQSV